MNNGIRKQPRRERLIVANGNTSDIINVVMQVANDDWVSEQICDFAQRFKGTDANDQYQKLKELWRYTRKEITYEEDPPGVQFVKEPARVYWDNQKGDGSDCKSKSLFEYFICRCIGVPCYFEFVSYFSYWEDSKKRITHVYPVAIIPGYGEVVIDAVHTKFDERAPDATRIVKKYSKVFKQMSDIYRVSGIKKGVQPTAADLEAEYTDRAKLVSPLSFVDFTRMSEGEMETFLIADRARILAQFYEGTPQGAAYRQRFESLKDALAAGLHRGSFNLFGVKSRTRPASGWLPLAAKGVDLRKGFNALFGDAASGADRVGAIEQLDCDTLFPTLPFQQWRALNGNDPDLYDIYQDAQQNKREKCNIENLWRDALNSWWEKTGTVLIYEFLQDSMKPADLYPPTRDILAVKQYKHKSFVDRINYGSKISRTNLRIWLENGCIANSIIGANGQSLGPATPLDWINAYKEGGKENISVNGIGLTLLKVCFAASIIGFKGLLKLIDVIKGNQTLKQAINSQVNDIQAFFQSFSQELDTLGIPEDFKRIGAGNNGGNDTDCGEGYHLENGVCVPNTATTGGNNNLLLIGGAIVVGAALLSKD